MKTVKELTVSLQLSKVTIYKALKRADLQEHIIKKDNITYIDEKGEQILIDMFSKASSKVNSKVNRSENDEILYLREQNKMLTEQLAALAKDLARLTENSQVLLREQNLKSLPPSASGKKSLWNRLFKRKN